MRQPDPWFGLRYNLNIYRGCQHHCIYCDLRSNCYQIEAFDRDVLVKTNAIQLLEQELSHKRKQGVIGFGSMSDCYMPLEKELELTRRALEVISRVPFGVHIITKSTLIRRDIDLLQQISKTYATVSITITTADDDLARKIEPGAPPSSERFRVIEELSRAGIQTGITLMPVLPYLTDNEENIQQILQKAAQAGVDYVIPAFSVTTRDRQREYFYSKLDILFPGIKQKYQAQFGDRYGCESSNSHRLQQVFKSECRRLNIRDHIIPFVPQESPAQLALGLF